MIRFIAFMFLFALTNNVNAQKEVIDKVVGMVGSEIILLSDIEEQHALMAAQNGTAPENARCFIVDQLLAQKLLLNQSKLDSLEVGEEEVEAQLTARIDRILAYMNNDVTQFEAYYGQSISAVKEEFRTDLKNQILIERMQGSIMQAVKVTPAEVKNFFNQIPVDSLPYFNSEVEIGEIVIKPSVNKEEKEKSRKSLEALKERIDAGEDFAELAKVYSDDPGSGRAGGDLGFQKRGTFVPEFEAAVYNLENGEISDIVETEFGFHLIQLIERRGNSVHARHILVKPAITPKDMELAVAKLDTIKMLLETDSISFSFAVKRFSNKDAQSYNNDGRMVNPQTGNTFFEIGDLEPEVYFTIDTMQINKISSPIEFADQTGEKGYRIIQLQSKTLPHKANLKQDYSKIQTAALEQKKSKYMEEWIGDKTGSTYIKVGGDYNTCPELDKWKTER